MELIQDMKMHFKKEKESLKNMIACGLRISMMIKLQFAHMNLNKLQEFLLIYTQYVRDLIHSLKISMRAIYLKEFLLDNHWLKI